MPMQRFADSCPNLPDSIEMLTWPPGGHGCLAILMSLRHLVVTVPSMMVTL